VQQFGRQLEPLLQGHGDVLGDGERAEERAVLEQHAPARAQLLALAGVESGGVAAENLDRAGSGRNEADDRLQQHRLARARGAHDRQHLAGAEIEIDVAVEHAPVDARRHAAEPDHRLRCGARRRGWKRRHR
jgi:hypothetical protein